MVKTPLVPPRSFMPLPNVNVNRKVLAGLFVSLFMAAFSSHSLALKSIERHGVTWNFKEDLPVGKYGTFANGDPWVVGPVTIVSISPASVSGRNGSMVNPSPLSGDQGLDSRMQRNVYVESLNIAASLPYTAKPGTSILSSISKATSEGDKPYLQQIDVLTVLGQAASPGDFRPPYVGDDKSLNWNKSDLDYNRLGRYAVPNSGTNLPAIEALTSYFEYPWIELSTGWTGRYFHAERNHPTGGYGREMAKAAGEALMWLQLNHADRDKEKLLIGVVQAGIDIYGVAMQGATWDADGGHNQGRKMLLLLAGKVLNDPAMLAFADAKQHLIFQDDQQTFFVSQTEVDITHSSAWDPGTRAEGVEPYTAEDIGLAEWGIRHAKQPEWNNKHWSATYRQVSGSATFSHVVAARLMGVEAEWNWPPVFAYYDRYFTKEWPEGIGYGVGANSISSFAADLYEAYISGEIPKNDDSGTPLEATEEPFASHDAGLYFLPQLVTLSSGSLDAEIFYTLDGTAPTPESSLYVTAIPVSDTTTIKSFARSAGKLDSPVVTTRLEFVKAGSSGVIRSDFNWGSIELPVLNSNFSISFKLSALSENLDGVVALSLGAADTWSDLVAIVRMNTDGFIDVRNGSVYTSESVFPYKALEVYDISMHIDFDRSTYSVYASSGAGAKVVIADNYSFRTEQVGATQVNALSYITLGEDSHSISDIKIGASLKSPPRPPSNIRVTGKRR